MRQLHRCPFGRSTLHNMHACMLMVRPDVEQYERKFPASMIDVIPTLCKIFEHCRPQRR